MSTGRAYHYHKYLMVQKFVTGALHALQFVKARLEERSTWAAMSAGIIGAAALSHPWSIAVAVFGVLGAVVPTSGKTPE